MQLERQPLPLPELRIAGVPIDQLRFEDIELHNYKHHGFIKFEVSV
jgi:thymidylate synthase